MPNTFSELASMAKLAADSGPPDQTDSLFAPADPQQPASQPDAVAPGNAIDQTQTNQPVGQDPEEAASEADAQTRSQALQPLS